MQGACSYVRCRVNVFSQQLQENAGKRPDGVAVCRREPGGATETATFSALARRAERTASLVRASYPRSAFVPLYGMRSPAMLAALVAVLEAGRAFVCLNHRLKRPQLAAILRSLGEPPVLCDRSGLALARQHLPGVRCLSIEDAAESGGHPEGAPAACESLPTLEATGATEVGCCLFTSGSTGAPKGVLVGARDLTERAQAECEWFGLDASDRILNVLPWSFDVGLNQALSAVLSGATLVIQDSWLPADVMKGVREQAVTGISAVPSIWRGFMSERAVFDRRGAHPSLRYVTVSGGDLLAEQLRALPSVVDGADIFKTYGQSETFRSTCLRPEDFEHRPTSVGRPFGNAVVRVVAADGGLSAAGEEGEIVHAGLGTMIGYLAEGVPKGAGLAMEDGRPSVRTGDMGYMDGGGFLFLRGRRDGMLKVAGYRVYPAEIAQAVARLSGVVEVEVAGVQDGRGETVPFAFVRTVKPCDEDAMRRDLSRALPSYMVPRIVAVPSIPLMANGKADFGTLSCLARARMGADAPGSG